MNITRGKFSPEKGTFKAIERAVRDFSDIISEATPEANGYSFYRGRLYSDESSPDALCLDLLGADIKGVFKKLTFVYNSNTKEIFYYGKFAQFLPSYEKEIGEKISAMLNILVKMYEKNNFVVSQFYFDTTASMTNDKLKTLFYISDPDTDCQENILFASAGDSYYMNYNIAEEKVTSQGTALQHRWGEIFTYVKDMNEISELCASKINELKTLPLPMSYILSLYTTTDEDGNKKLNVNIPGIKDWGNCSHEEIMSNAPQNIKTFYVNNSRMSLTYLRKIVPDTVNVYITMREDLKKAGITYPDGLGYNIL